MHVCIQGSRLDGGGGARAHVRAPMVMISSSLGRCTSAAQRGGNITFLFLFMCGNVDDAVVDVVVYAAHFIICDAAFHLFYVMVKLMTVSLNGNTTLSAIERG